MTTLMHGKRRVSIVEKRWIWKRLVNFLGPLLAYSVPQGFSGAAGWAFSGALGSIFWDPVLGALLGSPGAIFGTPVAFCGFGRDPWCSLHQIPLRQTARRRTAQKFAPGLAQNDTTTADHEDLNEENESRFLHRYAVVVQDLFL